MPRSPKRYGLREFNMGALADRYKAIHMLASQVVSHAAAHDVLDLTMATVVSVQQPGPLVWLLHVAPPSTGKTEMVAPLRPLHDKGVVYWTSKPTPKSFASGAHNEKGVKAQSLLPKLDGRCLIVKDMAPLLSAPASEVKDWLGRMTDIYDGEFNVDTGTQFTAADALRFKARFSLVACATTDGLYKHHRYMATMGSRLLYNRVPALTTSEESAGFTLDAAKDREQVKAALAAAVTEHVALVRLETEKDRPLPAWMDAYLRRLAQFTAKGRTSVRWVQDMETGKYSPEYGEPEGPFRLYQQFRSLLIGLIRVTGADKRSTALRLLDLLAHIARGTLDLDRYLAVETLRTSAKVYEIPVGVDEAGLMLATYRVGAVSDLADVSQRQMRTRFRMLRDLGLVRRRKVNLGLGRPADLYEPRHEWEDILLGSFTVPGWMHSTLPEGNIC